MIIYRNIYCPARGYTYSTEVMNSYKSVRAIGASLNYRQDDFGDWFKLF